MSELAVNKVYFLTDLLAEVLNPIKEATQLKDISFGKTDRVPTWRHTPEKF